MKMKKTELVEKIESCEQKAKTLANPETRTFKNADFPVGSHVWQGDVALVRLPDVPKGAKLQKNRTIRQIVEGNTRGSRHCVTIESMPKVDWYTPAEKNVLLGDIMDTTAPVEVEHPEHGNIVVPEGTYQVRYQRAYSPLEELKRQRD